MPKILSDDAVTQYARDGYYFPIRVLPTDEARAYRRCLEAAEARSGPQERAALRSDAHLVYTWANQLVRHPAILDAVEDVLGPNILCWASSFFIKDPGDPAYISWHQDSTYWGLEPADVVTAWLALSDVPLASGPMKFLPGSHLLEQIPHRDTFHQHNLLSRGQEVEVEVDEALGIYAPLQAGEISLHHIRLVHGSAPNTAHDRRIGFAIRYVPTHVRQTKGPDAALLVRGEDGYGHFEPATDPVADLAATAVAAQQYVRKRRTSYLMAGAAHG